MSSQDGPDAYAPACSMRMDVMTSPALRAEMTSAPSMVLPKTV